MKYDMLKFLYKITWIVILCIYPFNFVSAQSVKKGFKYLSLRDYKSAGHEFQNSLIKNQTDAMASYGLAITYFCIDNPDYEIAKAYSYIKNAEENYKKMTSKDLKKNKDLINESVLQEEKKKIEEAFINAQFENAQYLDTKEAYQYFMDTYPSSEHVSKALSRRDELRYEEARTLDTIEGYLQFIQSSPEATQVSEAKLRIEALAFADAQKKHTKESYQQFIENYPEAIQVEEARKLLFIKTHYDQDYLMGRFHPSVHPFFAPVDEQYLSYNKNLYLHSEAYDAFVKMHEAAKADGIDLVIISATRTFYYQKEIWMRKWSGMSLDPYEKTKAIMVYNSMPGLSRHHWGTDIDLNALHESYFETDRGIKVYQWLVENAPKFGYYQPYTALGVNRFTGYTEEKWHWSYMPVAKICLKEYLHEVGYDDINDFEGAEHAPIFRVIEEYVMGIDKSLWE